MAVLMELDQSDGERHMGENQYPSSSSSIRFTEKDSQQSPKEREGKLVAG